MSVPAPAGGGGGGKQPMSIRDMFRFADRVGVVLMALGTLGAIGDGCSTNLLLIFASDMMNADVQREEKIVEKAIREAAKRNGMGSAKALAKELVRSRRAVDRLYENKAQLNSVSMHLGEIAVRHGEEWRETPLWPDCKGWRASRSLQFRADPRSAQTGEN